MDRRGAAREHDAQLGGAAVSAAVFHPCASAGEVCYVGLGANLGDRHHSFDSALELMPGVVEAALAAGKHLISEKPCLLYTSPSPRDRTRSRMPSSA